MRFLSMLFAIVAFVALDTYALGQQQEQSQISFTVRTFRGGPDSESVGALCQQLRDQLQGYWIEEDKIPVWHPYCMVVLHANRSDYLRAVGRFGTQSRGSSQIKFHQQKVVKRRVDLLVDEHGEMPALRHEIAHIVLADHFGGQRPPRWIDEGIATMFDTTRKQSLHTRDCQKALQSGSALGMQQLLTLTEFQTTDQVATFYGQSLSLVRFLADRDDPSKLIRFTNSARSRGYDDALQQHYGIPNVAALEREWRKYAVSQHASKIRPVSLSSSMSTISTAKSD